MTLYAQFVVYVIPACAVVTLAAIAVGTWLKRAGTHYPEA